jgi:hypothetical protein
MVSTAWPVIWLGTWKRRDFLYQFTLTNTGSPAVRFRSLPVSRNCLSETDISNINIATIGTPVGWGDSTGDLNKMLVHHAPLAERHLELILPDYCWLGEIRCVG